MTEQFAYRVERRHPNGSRQVLWTWSERNARRLARGLPAEICRAAAPENMPKLRKKLAG